MIISNIGNFLANKEEVVKPWDLYSELFAEEQVLYEEQKEEQEFEEFKARRSAYASAYNSNRK